MTNDKALERYNRQLILKGFGMDKQQKLADAKALVIGAGGLGCPCLQYLAASGVGAIGIADNDTISLSDLHRQILYTTDDIGLNKAEIAAIKLRRLNPEITITTYPFRLQNSNVMDIIRQYDVVIDGTDNFASRYMINDACVILKKPLIYGAVSQYQGQVAVFNVSGNNTPGAHYRDIFPLPPGEGEILNCAEAGVLGVLPGIIGTMQAAQAILLISGLGAPLVNKMLTYDVLTHEMYEIALSSSASGMDALPKSEAAFLDRCYENVCLAEEMSVTEINAGKFNMLLKRPSVIAIDVREKGERPLITTFAHCQVPMSVFKEKIHEIAEHTILLFCQHGIRSVYAAEILQEIYGDSKTIFSLKGGIVKWEGKLGVES